MTQTTITEQVHVDLRIDGETISQDFAPGDHDLHDVIAELLIAQGFATIATSTNKKSKIAPVIEDIIDLSAEA